MSKYIFTNKKMYNVWLQATKNINWNVCLKIWGNKEMYQRKILSGIVAVQLYLLAIWPVWSTEEEAASITLFFN